MMERPEQNLSDPDFDELLALAQQDPVAFERRRALLIEEAIREAVANGGDEARIRGLQFQVDGMRRVNKTPQQTGNGLHAMLRDSLLTMQKEFARLVQIIRRPGQAQEKEPARTARIIPFKDE